MPSQFLLEQNSIPLPRMLATAIGLEEATVLQQLYYCLQNPKLTGTQANGQKWIRNLIECRDAEKQQRAEEHGKAIDWLSNFPFLSPYKIRRIFAKLERLGLIISNKLRATKWDHCKYYTINQDKLTELLKSLSLPICQFSTNRSVENLQMDLTTASKSYQIYNSTIPLQNLEREPGAENKSWEEEKDVSKDLTLRFDKKQEFDTQPKVSRSDKSSAAVPSGCELIDPNDLREFQTQLEDLGKRLGRKSPVAWAFTIVKNLNIGKPCTYWEEFKAGIPLGTAEQREWEIAPGVACSIAIQCLQQDYLSRPGTTPQEAARKATQTIARPNEMAAVWESIKAQVMFRRSEWERQSELGVQSPVLDSWMVPKAAVSVEEVAIALQGIQPALPVALLPNQELLPTVPIVEVESVIGGDNAETTLATALMGVTVTDYGSKAAHDNEEIAAAAKAKISAVLSKFARPTKRVATLAANMAEVKDAGITPVAKPLSSGGGLADYLCRIEVAEDDVW
ncbi:hypothetical protein QT972_00070 [Microcoleus sp. herbarium7]|uniref:hypothetical protein n=1 Tax=Microcoleus sp. herbarium7 TaxID=3055435 RepID=UPI002FD4C017